MFKRRSKQKIVTLIRQRNADIEIKERDGAKPRLMITGIFAGYTEEDIVEMILMENEDIDNRFGENFRENFKEVAKRKTCRNPKRENVSFEASLEVFKYMIRKERIHLDMGVCGIEEVINVSQCFKCNKFGDIARSCQLEVRCHYCGGENEGKDCNSDRLDCMNCKVARLPPDLINHHARDRLCPVYIRRENIARNGVSYSN